jgi:putative spermidine/putrescine transport system permease protein
MSRQARLVVTAIVSIVFGVAFAIFILGPLLVLVLWSIAGQWFVPSILPTEYTLRWYEWALTVPNVLASLQRSVLVATFVTIVTTLVSLAAALVIGRVKFPGREFVRALFSLPLMVPYIALGVGIAWMFYRSGMTGTLHGVVLAHLIATLPFGILIMTGAVEGLRPEIEEAAIVCGANRLQTLWRITLPLLRGAIFAQAVYVFMISMDEFTLTLLVAGPTTATLPVQMFSAISEGYIQISAALAIILLVPSLVLAYALARFSRTSLVHSPG